MKKISYRSVAIEKISVAVLVGLLSGAKKLVVSIDVAKTKMMAGFGSEDGTVVRLVRFVNPCQTRAFVDLVVQTGKALGVPTEALMEPIAPAALEAEHDLAVLAQRQALGR